MAEGGGGSGGKAAAIITAIGALLLGVAAVLGAFKPDKDAPPPTPGNGIPPPVIIQEDPYALPPGQGGGTPVQTPVQSPIEMPTQAAGQSARVASGGVVMLRLAPVGKRGSGPALVPGETLTVSASQPGWYSVSTATGRQGFLRADEVVLE